MNQLPINNTEQLINQTDLNRNLNHSPEGFNRNIGLANQESFITIITRNLNAIQNVCDRNIKKIHCSVPIILGATQSCVAVAYPAYWFLHITSALTTLISFKIAELQTNDARIADSNQIQRHRHLYDSYSSYELSSPIISTELTAYEELRSYSEKVSGDTESVILKLPLKELEKVVYYDKQFYDYDTLVMWHNSPNNKDKVCPHNRQPLIWNNLQRVENIYPKRLTSRAPALNTSNTAERLASFDSLRALELKQRLAIEELFVLLNIS